MPAGPATTGDHSGRAARLLTYRSLAAAAAEVRDEIVGAGGAEDSGPRIEALVADVRPDLVDGPYASPLVLPGQYREAVQLARASPTSDWFPAR